MIEIKLNVLQFERINEKNIEVNLKCNVINLDFFREALRTSEPICVVKKEAYEKAVLGLKFCAKAKAKNKTNVAREILDGLGESW